MAATAVAFAAPVAASLWLEHVGDPRGPHAPVLCIARGAFGVPCPFCGLTTSFSDMAGADPVAAAAAAPVGPLLWLGLLTAAVVCTIWAVRGSPPSIVVPLLDRAREVRAATWVVAAVTLAALSWVYQLLWGPYAVT